ncbi:MAG: glycosyltransferase [Phycisphaerales bacterium]|nr:MAG: glycosyltransferase [Phycisphaerales bacterium]
MRLLAVTHDFPNEGNTGLGIFAARQLLEMRRQGADITVLVPMVWCPGWLNSFKRWSIYNHRWRCEYEGLVAITAPYLRLPGKWYRPLAQRSVYHAIRNKAIQLHKAKPFSAIYSRFLYPEGYAAVRISKILGIPAVGVGAGSEVNVLPHESRLLKRDLVDILNGLDGVLASGPAVAAGISKMSNKEALVVHGVVDLEEFSPAPDKVSVRRELGLAPDKLIVLYVGGFLACKGVCELIEASARVLKQVPNTVVKMCGSGRQEGKMRQMIEERNAGGAIEIVGRVDPQQVHKWMQASDVLVLPSYAEGMPNVVMEAMACGLPVVASAVGGLPQEVGDCEGAILIAPKSVDALEQAMLRVIGDETLRRRMQLASRKRAEERFGVRRNARIVLDFLSEVVEKHGHARRTH